MSRICWFLLISTINAGFLQLTDQQVPIYLDGSTTLGSGYISMLGSDSQFKGHALSSTSYTITLWVQQITTSTGETQILLLQQSGINAQSGIAGAKVPSIHKTQTSVTGWIDTQTDFNNWKTIANVNESLWTWTHYFISICAVQRELRVSYTTWRGTASYDTQIFADDIVTFDSDSVAYLGGSPYSPGITGKFVDVRYYDTTWYTVAQAQGLALNRRCASPCWNSCWGPDETSCSGFEFLHPYYSTYLDTTDTLNEGKLEFKGTDVKFKGHALNSQEMSASAWVYPQMLTTNWSQLWWFSVAAGNDRRLCAFIRTNEFLARTDLSSDTNFGWILQYANISTQWIHIGLSLSQTTGQFICCLTVWGQSAQCNAETIPSEVLPFTTAEILYIGNHGQYSGIESIGGRILDFRFFANQALTQSQFEEMVDRTSCAPSCNGSCWGPDTFAWNDYIQVTDPRFSNTYAYDNLDYTTFAGNDRRADFYTFGGLNSSASFWFKRDSAYSPVTWETLMRVHHTSENCWDAGDRQPGIFLNSAEYVHAGVVQSSSNGQATLNTNKAAYTGNWWHIAVGISPTQLSICWTQFDLNARVTQCKSKSISLSTAWDPTAAGAAIWVGDDTTCCTGLKFQGQIVDVRYYPAKTLSQSDVEAMIAATTCVGDTEDCTGPDHTSVKYIYLTEKNFEYTTYTSGGQGVEYFYMTGTHVNLLSNPFGSSDYQITTWVFAEDRMDENSTYFRFQKYPINDADAAGQLASIPRLSKYNNKQRVEVSLETDDEKIDLNLSNYIPMFKKQFNSWGSVWNQVSVYNCYQEWGNTQSWKTQVPPAEDAGQFDSDGWVYIGGDDYIANSHLRITNALYYPNSWYDDTQINTQVASIGCDTSWNGQWYGPGILSCIYDEPIYVSDEWEPFTGDSLTWVTKSGTDDEFEGRYMSYSEYSIWAWFYLNSASDSANLHLIAMTSTQDDISATYRNQAPDLFITGTTVYAQVVTQDEAVHTASTGPVLIETWYNACVVVSQSNNSITLHLGSFDGVESSQTATFTDADAGYFDRNGYLYYGGIQTTSQDISIDGFMLDIRFWDTKAISASEFTAMLSSKGCHSKCDSCAGPTSCNCTACQSPLLLYNGCCYTTCPNNIENDGAQCLDCGIMWEESECEDSICSQCKNPYFRLENQCNVSCDSQYYGSTTSAPDYQWIPCHEAWDTWTGPGATDWIQCSPAWYRLPDAVTCSQTCPSSHAVESGIWQPCESFSGYSGSLDDPSGTSVESVCKPIWGDGVLKTGEECDDGNVQNEDGCSSDWLYESWLDCTDAGCEDIQAPKAYLQYESLVDNTYTVLLYFDEPVIAADPLKNNISLSVNNGIGISESKINESNKIVYNPHLISVVIEEDVPDGSTLTVEINTKITDNFQKELQDYTVSVNLETKLSIVLAEEVISSTETVLAGALAISAASGASNAGGATVAGASSFSCMNPTNFWLLVEILQIINFMLYLSLNMPLVLRVFFRLLSLVNGDFIPDVFGYFIEETGIDPPTRFADEELSSNFFLNAGPFMLMFAINYLLLSIFILLCKLLPKILSLQKIRENLTSGFPIRIAVEAFLELALACVLQLRNFMDDSVYNIPGTGTAIIFIAAYIQIIYFIIVKVVYQEQSILDSEDYQNKYGALYEAYKTSHWIYKWFWLFEASRRLSLILILVFLTNYPTFQIYAWVWLQFIWLLANIIIRPQTTRQQRFIKIGMETILLLSFMLMAILDSQYAGDEETRAIIAWILLGLLGGLVISFALYVIIAGIIDIFYTLIQRIRSCKKKPDTSKVVPAGDRVERRNHRNSTFALSDTQEIEPRNNESIFIKMFKDEYQFVKE